MVLYTTIFSTTLEAIVSRNLWEHEESPVRDEDDCSVLACRYP